MEALQIVSSFYCFLPSWHDKIEFFVHGLVSVLWWWVFFFSFSFAFPGCGSRVRWPGGRERRRLECLHVDWEPPDRAHGLPVAEEQIYSQASEVKERLHSWSPRGTLWRLLQPRKAVQAAGLQSSWKERLILKGNRKRGEDLFSKLLFICIMQKIYICCVLRGCRCSKKTQRLELL